MVDNTPKEHIEILKFLLQHIHDNLMKRGLTYWIEGGSLLGYLRAGDVIPWDDDIDICVDHRIISSPAFKDALKEMELLKVKFEDREINVITQHLRHMAKVAVPGMWVKTESGRIIGTPTLDIFSREWKGDTFRLASLTDRRRFPNCDFKRADIFPLQAVDFGGVICLAPNNGLPYLKAYYGENCLTEFKYDIRNEHRPTHKNSNDLN